MLVDIFNVFVLCCFALFIAGFFAAYRYRKGTMIFGFCVIFFFVLSLQSFYLETVDCSFDRTINVTSANFTVETAGDINCETVNAGINWPMGLLLFSFGFVSMFLIFLVKYLSDSMGPWSPFGDGGVPK